MKTPPQLAEQVKALNFETSEDEQAVRYYFSFGPDADMPQSVIRHMCRLVMRKGGCLDIFNPVHRKDCHWDEEHQRVAFCTWSPTEGRYISAK